MILIYSVHGKDFFFNYSDFNLDDNNIIVKWHDDEYCLPSVDLVLGVNKKPNLIDYVNSQYIIV